MDLKEKLIDLANQVNNEFCWDELRDVAESCLFELRESQASYLNGLADDDLELKYISDSVDLLDKILEEIKNIW